MKRLRIITLICLLLSAVLLGASALVRAGRKDNTLPTITVPDEPLSVSVKDLRSTALLSGITAWDDKDGDLTDQILLQSLIQQENKQLEATYVVVDSDDHIATASRIIKCSDYTPPRFRLTAPLTYSVGSPLELRSQLTASDPLDGDLSDKIRINTSNLTTRYEGIYPVSFEVTNSLGITSRITLEVTIHSPVPGEPTIALREYLVYCDADDTFEPLEYLSHVTDGDDRSIQVKLPDGGLQKGLNQVVYTCPGVNGTPGSTILYVVAE